MDTINKIKPILKPISDFERRMLAKMGETTEAHQRAMQLKLSGKRSEPDPVLERLKANKIVISGTPDKSIQEVTASLLEPLWIADAYVIFMRRNTCLCCGEIESTMDSPQLFLRHHTLQKNVSNPYLYTPVKHSKGDFPRLTLIKPTTSVVCQKCFTSKQADTKSPAESTKGIEFSVMSSLSELSTLLEEFDSLAKLERKTRLMDSIPFTLLDSNDSKSSEPVGATGYNILTERQENA